MLCYVMLCYVLSMYDVTQKVAKSGHFLAKSGQKVAKKWPKVAKKWPKSGQKVAKKWPKIGKKWPILSRMGELLKGTIFGLFLAFFGVFCPSGTPPRTPLGTPPYSHMGGMGGSQDPPIASWGGPQEGYNTSQIGRFGSHFGLLGGPRWPIGGRGTPIPNGRQGLSHSMKI